MAKGKIILSGVLAAVVVLCCVVGLLGLIDPRASNAEDVAGTLPRIITFQIEPAGIARGESAIMSWKAENAVAVNIDNDVGDVALSGQITITPAYSTTYGMMVSNDTGIRTRYITLQVSEVIPEETGLVGVDPVSGRNSSVDLSWEDYCYSSEYQVQVARDPMFTLKVYDSGVMQPADAVFPAFSYPPGRLEAGHTYYWRVRTVRAVTGQWAISPWSEARPITVGPGFPVRADSYGAQPPGAVNNNGGQSDAVRLSPSDDAMKKNGLADTPAWAIAVIIFGSLLIGLVLVFAIRAGKKI